MLSGSSRVARSFLRALDLPQHGERPDQKTHRRSVVRLQRDGLLGFERRVAGRANNVHVHRALDTLVVAVNYDVAEIDADAIADALGLGVLRLGKRRCLLDRKCAVDSRDYTRKLDERAVAHELDQAPTVGSDAGIEDAASVGLQPFKRPSLVGLH